MLAFYILTAIITAMALGAVAAFLYNRKKDLFRYRTVYFAGLAVFLAVQAFVMLYICLVRIPMDPGIPVEDLLIFAGTQGFGFIILTAPVFFIFSIAVSVSNISLIRHEGRSLKNLLGILLSIFILGAWLIVVIYDATFYGEEEAFRIHAIICGVYSTILAYFECMLAGTILCSLLAALHRPAFDKDHIVILGCRIRNDGTPLPLLKGRVDKAIEFDRLQQSATGKKAVFVPSGGQGSDEVISEALSMKNYLMSCGIEEERILIEDNSLNTLQNMRFSKEIIGNDGTGAVFATTNYHVLRSGILARKAGFAADGMGSRTKWYFWPNAFIREFVGLMAASYRQQIVFAIILTALYAVVTVICVG